MAGQDTTTFLPSSFAVPAGMLAQFPLWVLVFLSMTCTNSDLRFMLCGVTVLYALVAFCGAYTETQAESAKVTEAGQARTRQLEDEVKQLRNAAAAQADSIAELNRLLSRKQANSLLHVLSPPSPAPQAPGPHGIPGNRWPKPTGKMFAGLSSAPEMDALQAQVKRLEAALENERKTLATEREERSSLGREIGRLYGQISVLTEERDEMKDQAKVFQALEENHRLAVADTNRVGEIKMGFETQLGKQEQRLGEAERDLTRSRLDLGEAQLALTRSEQEKGRREVELEECVRELAQSKLDLDQRKSRLEQLEQEVVNFKLAGQQVERELVGERIEAARRNAQIQTAAWQKADFARQVASLSEELASARIEHAEAVVALETKSQQEKAQLRQEIGQAERDNRMLKEAARMSDAIREQERREMLAQLEKLQKEKSGLEKELKGRRQHWESEIAETKATYSRKSAELRLRESESSRDEMVAEVESPGAGKEESKEVAGLKRRLDGFQELRRTWQEERRVLTEEYGKRKKELDQARIRAERAGGEERREHEQTKKLLQAKEERLKELEAALQEKTARAAKPPARRPDEPTYAERFAFVDWDGTGTPPKYLPPPPPFNPEDDDEDWEAMEKDLNEVFDFQDRMKAGSKARKHKGERGREAEEAMEKILRARVKADSVAKSAEGKEVEEEEKKVAEGGEGEKMEEDEEL